MQLAIPVFGKMKLKALQLKIFKVSYEAFLKKLSAHYFKS